MSVLLLILKLVCTLKIKRKQFNLFMYTSLNRILFPVKNIHLNFIHVYLLIWDAFEVFLPLT